MFNLDRLTSADVEIVHVCLCRNQTAINTGKLPAPDGMSRTRKSYHRSFKNAEYDRLVDSYHPETRDRQRQMDAEHHMELVENPVKECLEVVKQLHTIFPTTPFTYLLMPGEFNDETFENLITRCLVGDYAKVSLHEDFGVAIKDLTHDEADFLINFIHKNAYLEVYCKIPDDFVNENAFKFSSVHYGWAKWVTLDQLKSIRNCDEVRLGSTNFTNEDINQFLHYWVNCEETMVKGYISIGVKRELETDKDVLMDGLVCETDNHFWFIKSKSRKSGKLRIGVNHIEFYIFAPRNPGIR